MCFYSIGLTNLDLGFRVKGRGFGNLVSNLKNNNKKIQNKKELFW